jgi:hypothetical protein
MPNCLRNSKTVTLFLLVVTLSRLFMPLFGLFTCSNNSAHEVPLGGFMSDHSQRPLDKSLRSVTLLLTALATLLTALTGAVIAGSLSTSSAALY